MKIYRVTEPVKKDGPRSANNDSVLESRSQHEVETQQISIPKESASSSPQEKFSENAKPNVKYGKLTQQGSDAVTVKQIDADKKLAKKISEQENAEIQAETSLTRNSISTLQNSLEGLETEVDTVAVEIEQKKYALVEHLNSLSAEEQRNYFENIQNGKTVNEDLTKAIESVRANGASEEVAEGAIRLLKQFAEKATSEETINKHIEKLRHYGFEPKF